MDVTNGLEYLHQHDFVHGDLKGVRKSSWCKIRVACNIDMQANILINSDRRACLVDFGLAAIIEDASSYDGPSGHKPGGTTRWMAPEILDPDRFGYTERSRRRLPSKSTDIYALGMTILEVRMSSPPPLLLSHSPIGGDRPPTLRECRARRCSDTESNEGKPT